MDYFELLHKSAKTLKLYIKRELNEEIFRVVKEMENISNEEWHIMIYYIPKLYTGFKGAI